jgi:hypothetical protein
MKAIKEQIYLIVYNDDISLNQKSIILWRIFQKYSKYKKPDNYKRIFHIWDITQSKIKNIIIDCYKETQYQEEDGFDFLIKEIFEIIQYNEEIKTFNKYLWFFNILK